MLDVCGEFADEHGLRFNTTKSVAITFVASPRDMGVEHADVTLVGNVLRRCDEVTHLGVVLDRSLKGRVPIVSRARKFFGAVNSVVAKVGGKFTSDSVCCRRNYCQCYCLAATCGGYTRSRRVVT
eukprot:m.217336 g.217336  ORF g.217336 m.217336 type:complete len:125 (+) comp39881_c1_seq16:1572-1946(+)